MRTKIFFTGLFLLIFCPNSIRCQNSNKYFFDFGVMVGPVFFHSDYGATFSVENLLKNNGSTFGAFCYVSKESDRHGFAEYLKYRAEISFMFVNFQHHGKWVDNLKNTLPVQQLRAMRGTTESVNLGLQIEYFPFKNDDYSYRDFNPYLSLGMQYSFFNSKAWSELGRLGDVAVTFPKYLNAFRTESSNVLSISSSIGARYKLDSSNAFVADIRLQHYFSDWVDGINPDTNFYPENQSNDFVVCVNIGYIFSFQ